MNEQFRAWLLSGDTAACTIMQYGSTFIFLRVAKSLDFDYLYCQHQYSECGIKRRDRFEYAGIYAKRLDLLYDGQSALRYVAGIDACTEERSPAYMTFVLQEAVRALVEAAIANDRSRLHVRSISDANLLERLNRCQAYQARPCARDAYLMNEDCSNPVFHCDYSPDKWTEDTLLAYIGDPQAYAQKEAAEYMATHQEAMLLEFLENDALAAAYKTLLDNPKNPIHAVKRIMAAVNAVNAKTVNVTIRLNDTEFRFKTGIRSLCRDCTSTYSSWDMVAADRREFERIFGRSADYGPLDILRITYGRTTIYTKE